MTGREHGQERTKADENFKRAFGRYPERVQLPEPDPKHAGEVARLFAQRHKDLTGEWPKPRLTEVRDVWRG